VKIFKLKNNYGGPGHNTSILKYYVAWGVKCNPFLGAFTKLQEVAISFVLSVCLPTWKSCAPTGWIFMKFDILVFFDNCCENSIFIKIGYKNAEYVTLTAFPLL
jgi:hypothetical protein